MVNTPYYTPAQAAEVLQVCPVTINRMIKRGELRAARVAGLWRIPADALHELFTNGGGAQ